MVLEPRCPQKKFFKRTPSGKTFWIRTCYAPIVCVGLVLGLSRLFIADLWSPAGKGLTSWLLFVMFRCVFVTFPCGILGEVWFLISIPDLCRLSFFVLFCSTLCPFLFCNRLAGEEGAGSFTLVF